MEQEELEWEKEVESTLKSLSTVQAPEGYVWMHWGVHSAEHRNHRAPADNPFHISQLSIILGSTDELLEGFASGIQGGSFDTSSPEYALIIHGPSTILTDLYQVPNSDEILRPLVPLLATH